MVRNDNKLHYVGLDRNARNDTKLPLLCNNRVVYNDIKLMIRYDSAFVT